MMMETIRKTIEVSWKIDLQLNDIYKWLANFNGSFFDKQDEQQIALWMLCNFTYFNDSEVDHLCRVIHRQLMHRYLLSREGCQEDTEKALSEFEKNVKYIPLGNAGSSGSMLLYTYRHVNQLGKLNCLSNVSLLQAEQSVALLDDGYYSCKTATRFLEENKELLQGHGIYCLSLIATEKAIQFMKDKDIELITGMVLDERSKVFASNSLMFKKYHMIRDFAYEIMKGYGERIAPSMPLGFDDGQYAIAFRHNTPNNSLPIFWSDRNDWFPIMKRKESPMKGKTSEDDYGYFV